MTDPQPLDDLEPAGSSSPARVLSPARSYGCSFACGNPYDYIFVSVADGTTEFCCLPCFVKLASEIVEAVTSGEGVEMMQALAELSQVESAPMRENTTRKRGKNAPVNADDDDVVEAFDAIITEDELPEKFR